jgi:hypothetical protein
MCIRFCTPIYSCFRLAKEVQRKGQPGGEDERAGCSQSDDTPLCLCCTPATLRRRSDVQYLACCLCEPPVLALRLVRRHQPILQRIMLVVRCSLLDELPPEGNHAQLRRHEHEEELKDGSIALFGLELGVAREKPAGDGLAEDSTAHLGGLVQSEGGGDMAVIGKGQLSLSLQRNVVDLLPLDEPRDDEDEQ